MNKQRRKRLEKSYGLIDEAMEIIQEVMDEEQQAILRMPDLLWRIFRGIGYVQVPYMFTK